MQRIHAADLPAQVGQQAIIRGWVHRRRVLKSVSFLIVRDRTGLAQVVLSPDRGDQLAGLPEETVVEVAGEVTTSEAAPGGVELTSPRIRLLGPPAAPTPFDLYRPRLTATLPTQLDHAPLALRHPRRAAALRIGAAAVAGFRATLDAVGFTEIYTPKVVGSATESGANVFGVDWFGTPAYLAQSPQFYKQLMVGVFERVYEVGPVFRAEPHDTSRHLAQYTSLDVEVGFIADHWDVVAVLRDVLAGVCEVVADRASAALATLGVAPPPVPDPLPSVTFREALAIAGSPSDQPDLSPADERALGQWAQRVYDSPFLVVTGYPAVKRPFYTEPDPADPTVTRSFDLIFRGTELVTGGQRRHRYDDYVAALTAAGQPLAAYESYVAAFRYGMPPHGGFAIGLERLVAALTGASNVREVTAFPRDLHRLAP